MYKMYAPRTGLGLELPSVSIDVGQFVSQVTKPLVNSAVNELKPRIPDLVNTAMPAVITALKKDAPKIIDAMGPPLEEYIRNRLYPKVLKPIVNEQISSLQGKATTAAKKASWVAGGVVASGVVLYLILRPRKGLV